MANKQLRVALSRLEDNVPPASSRSTAVSGILPHRSGVETQATKRISRSQSVMRSRNIDNNEEDDSTADEDGSTTDEDRLIIDEDGSTTTDDEDEESTNDEDSTKSDIPMRFRRLKARRRDNDDAATITRVTEPKRRFVEFAKEEATRSDVRASTTKDMKNTAPIKNLAIPRKTRDEQLSYSSFARKKYYTTGFINEETFEIFLGLFRWKLETLGPRNSTVFAIRRLLLMAHSLSPRIAFKGKSPRSIQQLVMYLRTLYYRKVELLMRMMTLVQESDISLYDLRSLLAPLNEQLRSWAVLSPTAIKRTIRCSLSTISGDDEFENVHLTTRISDSARWAARIICDQLITRLIRQVQLHQMSTGSIQRLLPQHFLVADLEPKQEFGIQPPIQSTADPVAKDSYLSKCDILRTKQETFRRTQKQQSVRSRSKPSDLPYEMNSLRNIIRLHCFMSLQRADKCLKYLNAKVFEAITHIIAYAIMVLRLKRNGGVSHRTSRGKSVVLKGEHIAYAVSELYGIRLLDIEKAMTEVRKKKNRLRKQDQKTQPVAPEHSTVLRLSQIDSAALT